MKLVFKTPLVFKTLYEKCTTVEYDIAVAEAILHAVSVCDSLNVRNSVVTNSNLVVFTIEEQALELSKFELNSFNRDVLFLFQFNLELISGESEVSLLVFNESQDYVS